MTFNSFIVINVAFSFLFPFILDEVRSQCFHLILTLWCDRWQSRCLTPLTLLWQAWPSGNVVEEKYGASQHTGCSY